MNYSKLLADYRLTCDIQIINLEWPDISFGVKTSSEVNDERRQYKEKKLTKID